MGVIRMEELADGTAGLHTLDDGAKNQAAPERPAETPSEWERELERIAKSMNVEIDYSELVGPDLIYAAFKGLKWTSARGKDRTSTACVFIDTSRRRLITSDEGLYHPVFSRMWAIMLESKTGYIVEYNTKKYDGLIAKYTKRANPLGGIAYSL